MKALLVLVFVLSTPLVASARSQRVAVPGAYELGALETDDEGSDRAIGQLECPKLSAVPMTEHLHGVAIKLYVR